jgi:predicted CoA-substrate-specific enzyme activase
MKLPVLGVDIGSVSVCLVLHSGEDPDEGRRPGRILGTQYRFHQGMIRQTLVAALEQLFSEARVLGLGGVACTSTTPAVLRRARRYDSHLCAVQAARSLHPHLGSLLMVGGERFALLRFDEAGGFRGLKASTSCAAGTGSFLDQQARRLGLADSAELSEKALSSRGTPPKIASRCSVFAKTDLCHAQQAGYSLPEICDGLCLGLARNIADTISGGGATPGPAILAGGVARNAAVVRHLEALLGTLLEVDDWSHLYGAMGAGLCLLAEEEADAEGQTIPPDPAELVIAHDEAKSHYYPPLELRLSDYPEFVAEESYLFQPRVSPLRLPVEVDIYVPWPQGARRRVVLGVDIGSTSTKAVVLGEDAHVLAGFYTRTAGRPLAAVQGIFEALQTLASDKEVGLEFLAVGSTGAGRKFIGEVIGSDLILNEITAHARAAWELDPCIDTIIEIGGQDAKFTTLRDGVVTFSQMNTVCAAGTGSFIEEQAAKLGVPLQEVSRRAEGARAPLASDRCTVFMERDINHYLSRRYSVEEILAAVMYSVRENYLLKVASPGLIGERICFQGATAKNRCLVAAFEQKLGKPIHVSRYCHLTGALGVALIALREGRTEAAAPKSRFRGLELYREEIPVRGETCELCANHCRLRIAEVRGETVAYGFLCGRDYRVGRRPAATGLDPLREHARAFREREGGTHEPLREGPIVGIPAALHLREELPLWKRFFAELGLPVVTSEGFREALKTGKELTGAEFCAPVTALHGHALYVADRCDYIFLPMYLEGPRPGPARAAYSYYCYYTQFAPSLVSLLETSGIREKTLLPLVQHGGPGRPLTAAGRRLRRRTVQELLAAVQHALGEAGSLLGADQVSRAYHRALGAHAAGRRRLRQIYTRGQAADTDIAVALLGRPYQILDRELNKGIPEIFASQGVRAYTQDMLPPFEELLPDGAGNAEAPNGVDAARRLAAELQPLLRAVHWHFASELLRSAAVCVLTEGLYPVLITAFKCSPDSFAVEYFRRLLDAYRKPYLVLQIDEHDSSVGYETRIEAAVHAFRNHLRDRQGAGRQGAGRQGAGRQATGKTAAGTAPARPAAGAGRRLSPRVESRLEGRTLLFPNWDPITVPLVVANLQRAGIDARALEEHELTIQKSMRLNTGQCIPLNAIVQQMVDYLQSHDLDPGRTVLWMTRSDWACNIQLFPQYIKTLLESQGGGLERAGVYVGEFSHLELSPRLSIGVYLAYLFGGLLRRAGCRIRPYELEPGRTDRTIVEARGLLADMLRGTRPRDETLSRVMAEFRAIPRSVSVRPKVAIFGDLYVRDNEVMNQGLIARIEGEGGEVVTTPYSEYVRIVAESTFRRWQAGGQHFRAAAYRGLLAAVDWVERRLLPLCGDYLDAPPPLHDPQLEENLAQFGLRPEQHGESFDNILKVLHLLRRHPDLALFVQTNPAFCCPSLVTEAMAARIETVTGVPVVTVTYDGTGASKNDLVAPYLRYPRRVAAPV